MSSRPEAHRCEGLLSWALLTVNQMWAQRPVSNACDCSQILNLEAYVGTQVSRRKVDKLKGDRSEHKPSIPIDKAEHCTDKHADNQRWVQKDWNTKRPPTDMSLLWCFWGRNYAFCPLPCSGTLIAPSAIPARFWALPGSKNGSGTIGPAFPC